MTNIARALLLAFACLIVLSGCDSGEELSQSQDRDGYAPQMGVMAGDPNDYGE